MIFFRLPCHLQVLQLNVKLGGGNPAERKILVDPDWEFDFGFGPAWINHNYIQFDGQRFDLNDFNKITDPTVTSVARFGYNITKKISKLA